MLENIIVAAVVIAMLAVVCIIGWVAVMYIFPNIRAIKRWLESLPDCDHIEDFK